MKALFVHELRRGRLLPVFGLALGLLVAALCGLYGAYVRLIPISLIDDETMFFGVLLVAFVIAVAGGAGLFASEVESGTLPILLALPLSRRRIWLAKVLAGLALAVCAAGALVALSYPALPNHGGLVMFRDDLWMLVPWWFVAFFAAVLSSALFAHMVSALMAALLLLAGMFAFTTALVELCGGALVGSSRVVDETLWALALAPGLLLGSVIAFARGELLVSWRRWPLAACAVVLYGIAVILLIAGGFHWALRYQRARVAAISVLGLSGDGAVAILDTVMSPVHLSQGAPDGVTGYRRDYTVLLDLKTGRELLVGRGQGVAAASPDRRWVAFAFVPQPFALTWRPAAHPIGPPRIETRDVRTGKTTRPMWPPKGKDFIYPEFESAQFRSAAWSPDGSWLALEGWVQTSIRPVDELLLMRRDGSEALAVPLWPGRDGRGNWGWDPAGKAVYTLEFAPSNGPVLVRRDLPGGRATTLWDPREAAGLPRGYVPSAARIAASPGGRWIAVRLVEVLYSQARYVDSLVAVFAVSTDGKQSVLLSQTSQPSLAGSPDEPNDCAWSNDGKRLYYLVASQQGPTELRLWRSGQDKATPVRLPARARPVEIAMLPSGELLIVGVSGRSAVAARPRMLRLLLANESGQVRLVPHGRGLLAGRFLVGVDPGGRAIVAWWGSGRPPGGVGAIDLGTGKLTRIYP